MDGIIQVRAGEVTGAFLADRARRMHAGSFHQQARTELEVWQAALAAELRRIRLTLRQANCLAAAMNGAMMSAAVAGTFPVTYATAADSFALARSGVPNPELSSYGHEWRIDEKELLDYLVTLGPAADHALHNAIDQWWDGRHAPTIDGWAEVGLTVTSE